MVEKHNEAVAALEGHLVKYLKASIYRLRRNDLRQEVNGYNMDRFDFRNCQHDIDLICRLRFPR